MAEHCRQFASQRRPQQLSGATDEWLIDDGQTFVKPHLANGFAQSTTPSQPLEDGGLAVLTARMYPAHCVPPQAPPSSSAGLTGMSQPRAKSWVFGSATRKLSRRIFPSFLKR